MTPDQPATQPAARVVHPAAVRVGVIDSGAVGAPAPIVVEPAVNAATPAPHDRHAILVDGVPTAAHLEHHGSPRATLVVGDGVDAARTSVLLLPPERASGPWRGALRREVVVDGWRFEIEIEGERRAALRERARRGQGPAAHGGPTEVRAIIPGRVLALSVVPGDAVVAGQQLMVVEAMKMQNELRAPRDGIVSRVAVGADQTLDVGDLLLVLQ